MDKTIEAAVAAAYPSIKWRFEYNPWFPGEVKITILDDQGMIPYPIYNEFWFRLNESPAFVLATLRSKVVWRWLLRSKARLTSADYVTFRRYARLKRVYRYMETR